MFKITAMEKKSFFRTVPKTWIVLTLSACTLALPACEEEEDAAPEEMDTVAASATLDPGQETADVSSSGSGSFEGTFDKSNGQFSFTLNWQDLTGPPAMMHFHGPAAPGVDAGVKIGIGGFPEAASGSVSGTVTVEEEDRADLLNGKWYVNIHTEAYGAGEIRGQVTFPAGSGGNNGGGGGDGGGDYEY